MSKSVHHYGYLKQNPGMNTKSQLVVQCYQLAFLLKSLLKKQENKLWNKKNINYTIIYGRKKQNQKIMS